MYNNNTITATNTIDKYNDNITTARNTIDKYNNNTTTATDTVYMYNDNTTQLKIHRYNSYNINCYRYHRYVR